MADIKKDIYELRKPLLKNILYHEMKDDLQISRCIEYGIEHIKDESTQIAFANNIKVCFQELKRFRGDTACFFHERNQYIKSLGCAVSSMSCLSAKDDCGIDRPKIKDAYDRIDEESLTKYPREWAFELVTEYSPYGKELKEFAEKADKAKKDWKKETYPCIEKEVKAKASENKAKDQTKQR